MSEASDGSLCNVIGPSLIEQICCGIQATVVLRAKRGCQAFPLEIHQHQICPQRSKRASDGLAQIAGRAGRYQRDGTFGIVQLRR